MRRLTMQKKVRKAVIPAAGLGTRFLPATKAQPKEMLPIVDKPTLQYIIEEAVASGIEEILIITGRNKKSIEDHFDKSVELELELENKGKKELLEIVQNISNMINIHYIRQKEPKGLGDAIYCARSFIGDEPFAVMLGDDIVDNDVPCLRQLMDAYEEYRTTILGVQKVEPENVNKYGIIEAVMKVIVKGRENRDQLEIFSIEGFVPADHLLRKIDSAVDFSHIYDIVEDLYCADNGRPSIDPVVIFKMVLIQHLYGLPSLRRTVEEIKMNVAYRWFLGYLMNEQIPHFSTVSYNFKHRYTEKTIEEIFYWILNEIETAGYLSPEAVFVDGTHIKANANLKKAVKKAVPQAAKIYEKQLMEEINEERNDHGKKPFDETKPPEEKEISESTTDPESGVFHKGEHKKCFAYTAQTGCDKNGYVMDVTVNPGNVHDSVAFDGLYDRLAEKNPEIKAVVADAGYKTSWISKRILDDGRIPVLPYKRPMSKKGFFPPYEYVYDEYFNCVICPENQVLSYATTNREGYREFKSKGYICENCPSRHLCTENQKFEKTVTKHIWSDYLETVEDIRHTPEYKALYERRKETIERVFADAKEKYAMRYTPYRGLSQVTNWVRLKFATMNLKKYALHRWKRSHQYSALINLYTFFCQNKTHNPKSRLKFRVIRQTEGHRL